MEILKCVQECRECSDTYESTEGGTVNPTCPPPSFNSDTWPVWSCLSFCPHTQGYFIAHPERSVISAISVSVSVKDKDPFKTKHMNTITLRITSQCHHMHVFQFFWLSHHDFSHLAHLGWVTCPVDLTTVWSLLVPYSSSCCFFPPFLWPFSFLSLLGKIISEPFCLL